MSGSAMQALLGERVISFNPLLARVAGDAQGGLFLSQCCFLSQVHGDKDGWFYSTDSQWFEATFLTRKEIARVRGILEEKGIIEHKVRGQAHKTYYRVNWHELENALLIHAKGNTKNSTKNAQNDQKAICENELVKNCTELPKGHLQIAQKDICKHPKGTFANSPKGHTKRELREDKERIKKESSLNNSSSGQTVDNSEPTADPRRGFSEALQKLTGQKRAGGAKQGQGASFLAQAVP